MEVPFPMDKERNEMKIKPQVRNAALVGALAAVAATAWATSDAYYPASRSASIEAPAAASNGIVPAEESLAPNERIVSEPIAAPVVDRGIAQPGITVESRRLTLDERIQSQVMDKLASNDRLSGKIGVESRDAVVRLTGYTRTVGQAWRAERDARSIVGVKYVQNEIRARVGGSV
jgi:hypothetical protein